MRFLAQSTRVRVATGTARLLLAAAMAMLLLPLLVSVWASLTPGSMVSLPTQEVSLRWYQALATDPRWRLAMGNSLTIAAATAALATLAGLGSATVCAASPRTAAWLTPLLLAPLVIPPVALAMGQLPVLHALGVWGTASALVLAHTCWTLPVVHLVLVQRLLELDATLVAAARGLGASRWRAWRWVVLPQLQGSLVIAALFAFVLSFNEFLLALFVGTPQSDTLPRVIWPSLRYTLSPAVAAASTVSTGIAALCLVVVAAFGWSAFRGASSSSR